MDKAPPPMGGVSSGGAPKTPKRTQDSCREPPERDLDVELEPVAGARPSLREHHHHQGRKQNCQEPAPLLFSLRPPWPWPSPCTRTWTWSWWAAAGERPSPRKQQQQGRRRTQAPIHSRVEETRGDSDGDPNAQPVLEASPPWRFLNTFLPPASGASCLSRRLLLAADLPSGTAGPAIMSSSIMTLCSFSLFCSVHLSFWGVPDLRIRQDPGQLQGAAGEGPGRGVGASGRCETQPEGAPPPPGTEAELPGTSAFALLPEAPVAVAVSLHPDLDLELVGGSWRETQPEEAAAAGAKENTGSYVILILGSVFKQTTLCQPGGGNQGGL
ncbi:uncharacterized protein LOC140702536 isoform X2 [Pogona vitticeps]